MEKFTRIIVMSKYALRQVNFEKRQEQIKKVTDRVSGGGRKGKGWNVVADMKEYGEQAYGSKDANYRFDCTFTLTCDVERSTLESESKFIIYNVMNPAGTKDGWNVRLIDDKDVSEKTPEGELADSFLEIPDDWKTYFSHLYQRDSQISIVMSALNAGISSGFNNRFHTTLFGPPACGKTGILRAVKDMLGEDMVLEYDATATTSAGAIKDLMNRTVVPRVMIVEEIEKCDENSLRWLLGLLDHRAEIRKVTARDQMQKEIKLLCLATVNNYDLFGKVLSGALASRFAHHVYCPRPTREILRMILVREVEKIEGRTEWIDPAIDYAIANQIDDPRNVIAICLCGQDQLLDGSYQKMLLECKRIEVPIED